MMQRRTRENLRAVAGAVTFGTGIAAGLYWAAAANRPRFTFRERSVLITGGSRGLGLVLARQLALEGARVGVLARDEGELERAGEELRELGAHAVAVACDLRDAKQIGPAVDSIADRLGGLDLVINNAGVMQVGPMEHMTDADLAESLDLHVWAPWHVTYAALPHLLRRGEGRIVNVCSIGGKVAMPHLLPYTAGKFAEVGLSDGLRAELKPRNIHVTTVVPGLMRTGSPPNAMFKGKHREEYAWFAISDSLPGVSVSAERAARQIIDATRRRATHLYITPQARAASICNELLPGLVAWITSRVDRLLPAATADRDVQSHPGHQSASRWAPSALTRLGDKAAERNNERRDNLRRRMEGGS